MKPKIMPFFTSTGGWTFTDSDPLGMVTEESVWTSYSPVASEDREHKKSVILTSIRFTYKSLVLNNSYTNITILLPLFFTENNRSCKKNLIGTTDNVQIS